MYLNKLLVLALSVEAIWETSKMVWQEGKLSVDRVGALIIGVVLAVASNVDFFAAVGLPLDTAYLGQVFTGIMVSRGSNALHDFVSAITKLADNV